MGRWGEISGEACILGAGVRVRIVLQMTESRMSFVPDAMVRRCKQNPRFIADVKSRQHASELLHGGVTRAIVVDGDAKAFHARPRQILEHRRKPAGGGTLRDFHQNLLGSQVAFFHLDGLERSPERPLRSCALLAANLAHGRASFFHVA